MDDGGACALTTICTRKDFASNMSSSVAPPRLAVRVCSLSVSLECFLLSATVDVHCSGGAAYILDRAVSPSAVTLCRQSVRIIPQWGLTPAKACGSVRNCTDAPSNPSSSPSPIALSSIPTSVFCLREWDHPASFFGDGLDQDRQPWPASAFGGWPSSAAMAWLSRSLSLFNSPTILSISNMSSCKLIPSEACESASANP
jgi:hypothetical protein